MSDRATYLNGPEWPDPHLGGPCTVTLGSPGVFVTVDDLGDGTGSIECPSGCGLWVEFEFATGKVLARA